MGWSESDYRCKKHPKHTQSPGVCSSCLRERLSQLSSSNAILTTTPFTSSSFSSYSSAYASSYSSPAHLWMSHNEGGFGRSRSMVHVARELPGDVVSAVEKKKKGGFWSKLLRPVSSKRRKEVLSHSKTMREVATIWVRTRK
ncbi:uncharacterized protein LOC131234442 [Magnolia sinica]|uniref:uncharacterized protein LOC131234442 n=1 Tax=Magnolia sinica TaxID=86752 RepID=UPI002658926C|nr:uncharacterized protein LOC131234442 [Magnolia sinica]